MAVTGAIYNHLIFGGVDSADYGIYITGEAVYNAPSRAVDMITVPGRNGAVALDQGRFENIVVTYPAGTFGDNQTDFRTALSDFRNAILSQRGYQRLEDTYHPDEYRMGIYVEPIEVDPVHYGEAGQFTLSFNCKPQRFLTSGETEVAITSGNSITNPTLFESSPLIKAKGYGTIKFNGYETTVENTPIGDVVLAGAKDFSVYIPIGQGASTIDINETITVDTSVLNTNDPINFVGTKASWTIDLDQYHGRTVFDYVTFYNETGIPATTNFVVKDIQAIVTTSFPPIQFVFGTASTATYTVGFNYKYGNTAGTSFKTVTIDYNGAQTFTIFVSGASKDGRKSETVTFTTSEIDAYSTVTVSDPIFIDCETGEAYWMVNNKVVDANSVVSIGSELPTLASGSNQIIYNNTFTNFKITPRWWKV